MVFVLFSCTTSHGEYQKCSYGGTDIESCFEALNGLVASGWELHEVYLSEATGKQMRLPVEAFDGELANTQLEQLQRTWETILKYPAYFLKVFAKNQLIRRDIDRSKEAQKRVSRQREETKRLVENLFKRMDTIQAHIQETKAQWGVK